MKFTMALFVSKKQDKMKLISEHIVTDDIEIEKVHATAYKAVFNVIGTHIIEMTIHAKTAFDLWGKLIHLEKTGIILKDNA